MHTLYEYTKGAAMKNFAALTVLVILAACAGASYRPMIDSRNVDMNKFEADLRDCQQYATQVAGAGTSAAVGAGVGALFGAVLAAAVGHGVSRNSMAGVGAVSGAASGGVEGETNQRDVIRRCIAGRGYSVLQ